MTCSHCQSAEDVFSRGLARKELADYQKKGAAKTTRLLLEQLTQQPVAGLSLLDIGGGIGAIQHGLAQAGIASGTDVDASTAYLNTARQHAETLGYADRMTYQHGDFVDLAPQLDSADIVTLDRVICCYPDMRALVNLSSSKAKKWYGIIFPHDNILTRSGIPIFNFLAFRLWNNPFRTFIHPTSEIDGIIRNNGLKRVFHRHVGLWQVMLYQHA